MTVRILLADNDDSFTRNLDHCLHAATGSVPHIVRHTELTAAPQRYQPSQYDLIVISPGPGHPEEYTGYDTYIESGTPVLGICLGLQIINEHFGGKTRRLAGCIHGKTDDIRIAMQWPHTQATHTAANTDASTGKGMHDPACCILPSSMERTYTTTGTVARYHSLYLAELGADLDVFAHTADGLPMAVRHTSKPLVGYQFHPESFLTHNGTWYIHHALGILNIRHL